MKQQAYNEWYNLIIMTTETFFDKNGKEIREGDVLAIPDLFEIESSRDERVKTDHLVKVIFDIKRGGLAVDLGLLSDLKAEYGQHWEILSSGSNS